MNDFYWDLIEANKDAIVFTEYEDAYMGHTISLDGKSVAVYHTNLVIACIVNMLKNDERYIKDLAVATNEDEEAMVNEILKDAEVYLDDVVLKELSTLDKSNAPIFVKAPTHDSRFEYMEEE